MKKVLLSITACLSLFTATPTFAIGFRLPPINTTRMFRVPLAARLRDQGYGRPATNILNFTFSTPQFTRRTP